MSKVKEIEITHYSEEDMKLLIAACRDNNIDVGKAVERDLMAMAGVPLEKRVYRSCTYIRSAGPGGEVLGYPRIFCDGDTFRSVVLPKEYEAVMPDIKEVTRYEMKLTPVAKVVYVGDVELTLDELSSVLSEAKLKALFGHL